MLLRLRVTVSGQITQESVQTAAHRLRNQQVLETGRTRHSGAAHARRAGWASTRLALIRLQRKTEKRRRGTMPVAVAVAVAGRSGLAGAFPAPPRPSPLLFLETEAPL